MPSGSTNSANILGRYGGPYYRRAAGGKGKSILVHWVKGHWNGRRGNARAYINGHWADNPKKK